MFSSSSTQCRAANGVCDTAENCTGSSGTCPANTFRGTGTTCRTAAGICDTAETCSGTSGSCPADTFKTTQCRAAAGICDVAETCSGSSATCPTNVFKTSICRAAAGECDVAETCTGSVSTCPTDVFKPTGSGCSSDHDVCTNDVCNANGQCSHPNNHAACDDGLACTANDTCNGGDCSGELKDCSEDPDDLCTLDTCSEEEGGICQHSNVCNDICRRPAWWGTRGDTLVQGLLDATGGLEVCGQTITETTVEGGQSVDELGLSSALEGLCVSVDREPIRRLYRELLTAELNCAISGRPTNCDAVVGQFIDVSFSECDHLCEIGDATSATARQCARQLACFNNGGKLVNGHCAIGRCNITGQLCGGDSGLCPPITLVTHVVFQTCGHFDDNCRDERFCNAGLNIPAGCDDNSSQNLSRSSSAACREAKDNECTIDDCPFGDDD